MPNADRTYGDVALSLDEGGGIAIVEIRRPPNNYFDAELISSLSDCYEYLDGNPNARVIVLCAEGRHFCAGANFGAGAGTSSTPQKDLYTEAARLVDAKLPVVAAVQGAAIGGGLGLACSADFRVGSRDTRMSANFSQLGFHHGFGLTITLPPIVGQQKALALLYTGRRIDGAEALNIGLLDRLVEPDQVRAAAIQLASEIAASAPLAVRSIRATMRAGIGERYREATAREGREQAWLRATEDFKEGIKATAERRTPLFKGR